jgi:hypothetical protein
VEVKWQDSEREYPLYIFSLLVPKMANIFGNSSKATTMYTTNFSIKMSANNSSFNLYDVV